MPIRFEGKIVSQIKQDDFIELIQKRHEMSMYDLPLHNGAISHELLINEFLGTILRTILGTLLGSILKNFGDNFESNFEDNFGVNFWDNFRTVTGTILGSISETIWGQFCHIRK